jgi:uncharacterized protein YegJ (DUF2314 family)
MKKIKADNKTDIADIETGNVLHMCKECSEQRKEQWQRQHPLLIGQLGDYVKIAVSDKNGTEHLWFKIIKSTKSGLLGECNNYPIMVKNIKFGELLEFKMNEVEDYHANKI